MKLQTHVFLGGGEITPGVLGGVVAAAEVHKSPCVGNVSISGEDLLARM